MSTLFSGTPPKNGPCNALTAVAGVGEARDVELGAGVAWVKGPDVVLSSEGADVAVAVVVIMTMEFVASVGNVVMKPGFCLSSKFPAFTIAAMPAITAISRWKQMN